MHVLFDVNGKKSGKVEADMNNDTKLKVNMPNDNFCGQKNLYNITKLVN